MIKFFAAMILLTAVCLAGSASVAEVRTRPAPAAASPTVAVQDCSVFYADSARGFGWGSGPGRSVGFGTFEGALPRYPDNSFPNWYGICREWGHYSSTGSPRW